MSALTILLIVTAVANTINLGFQIARLIRG